MAKHKKENLPNTTSHAFDEMVKELVLVRDVDAGQLRMLERDKLYLPTHPKEEPEDYDIRLKRPSFFNAFSRTHEALTGLVFQKDPTLEDVPEIIEGHWENIDNAGTHGTVFTKMAFDDIMVVGHGAILVDMPPVVNAGGLSLLNERENAQAGIRPFWVWVRKDDILSWREVVVDGRKLLSQVVIREFITKPNGDFGSVWVTQYRVLRRILNEETDLPQVTFDVLQINKKEEVVIVESGIIAPLTEIPLVPVYSNKTGFFTSRPALVDLAWQNILHYQTTSDMLHNAHITCIPILHVKGVDGDIVVGPNSAIETDVDGEVKWVEASGAGVDKALSILSQTEKHMAVLGIGMLTGEPRTNETAEARRIDKVEQDSVVASAVASMENGLERALDIHAEFLSLEDGGKVILNREFRGDADEIIRGAVTNPATEQETDADAE